ncbi:myocyte-specific enhancer factor 2D isoform X13 [Gambusia affinis]|uniref:myocyte-specific enhancer factor 2D isoform X13 n=1 Tax=Gambusia affinis TaxID=33528 RepID=UPI001CDBE7F1|nr:myocyte-specific enhancer factor 2D isoform X13 [Gambusia affinis]XP_043971995.1 myocyte-specific enhancer factor 2D isoform X13 [Gambusia affinis]XP_043971996.1 myocyte-specific enhancer factor 2D isoform X13 [Gambusia affinis]
MGRKKIQIQRITDERNRQVTFTKRKFGLMKKAYELSVLCDCEIALIIFNHSNKLFQYASTDMDKVLLKYTEYNEPHESRTNADIIETLRKKGFNGCNSPEPDGDDSIDQSPLNDRKTEDLDSLFKRYGSTVPQPTFPMPVTVPVTNQNAAAALQFSNNPGGALVTTTSFVTSTLTDPRLLSPQQQPLQRNTVSPGLPQRPASAGAMLGGDLGNSNGACPSPVPNGYISARASPGLLSVSNGNSLGKVVPAKSPPPPSPQLVNSRKPDLRVITSQSGKSLLQLNAQRLGSSHVTQPLTTPVVSVATPSLLAPFPGMQTAYNTEYQLTSADLTALQTFTPPGLVPGNMAAWQQQPVVSQQQQQHQQQQQQLTLASLNNLVSVGPVPQSAALTVNTNPNVNIKSEPVSPNRDRSTPSSTGGPAVGAGPQIQGQGLVSIAFPGTQGRSPVDSLSSNGSSYEGSDRDDGAQGRGGGQDFHHQAAAGAQPSTMVLLRPSSAEPQEQDGTNVKRVRLDAWVT